MVDVPSGRDVGKIDRHGQLADRLKATDRAHKLQPQRRHGMEPGEHALELVEIGTKPTEMRLVRATVKPMEVTAQIHRRIQGAGRVAVDDAHFQANAVVGDEAEDFVCFLDIPPSRLRNSWIHQIVTLKI